MEGMVVCSICGYRINATTIKTFFNFDILICYATSFYTKQSMIRSKISPHPIVEASVTAVCGAVAHVIALIMSIQYIDETLCAS